REGRGRRALPVGRLVVTADEFVDHEWLGLARQHERSEPPRQERVESREHLVRSQDPCAKTLVELLDPRRRVDNVADRPVLVVVDRSDMAEDHLPGMETDARRYLDVTRLTIEAIDRRRQLASRMTGSAAEGGVGRRRGPDGECRIPDDVGDRASVAADRLEEHRLGAAVQTGPAPGIPWC